MITSADTVSRTIRIGNLPLGKNRYAVSIEDVQNLFSQFGKVAMVELIYYGQRDVRRYAAGKAFVEFDSVSDYSNAVKELCRSIVKQEEQGQEKKEMEKNFVPPKRVLTLGGNELTVKTKEEHLEKQKLKKAGGKRSRNNDDVNCF